MNIKNIVFPTAIALLITASNSNAEVNGPTMLPDFPDPLIEHEMNFTCKGKWPGSSNCNWIWRKPDGYIVPELTVVRKTTSRTTSKVTDYGLQAKNSIMYFSVRVNEGDMFDPGKHTTSYEVKYYTLDLGL